VLIDDGEHPEGWATYTGATGPEARPDYVISDLSELLGIMDSWRLPSGRASTPPRRGHATGRRSGAQGDRATLV